MPTNAKRKGNMGDKKASTTVDGGGFHLDLDERPTEEAVLITIFKKIQVVYNTSPADTRLHLAKMALQEARNAKEKNAHVQKVLHQDSLCILLATRLLQLGPHFQCRCELSVTWLSKSINICMGIYVSRIELRCITLCKLASRKQFPSYETVQRLLADAERGDTKAKENITGLCKLILQCDKADEGNISIWADVIGKMDSYAQLAFSELTDVLEEMSPLYIEALNMYRLNVIRALQHAWSLLDKNALDGDNNLKHLDSIVARVALYLTPTEGAPRAPEPLLGEWMLTYVWDYLTRIQGGIAEICCWFEALLDYWRILHGKTHTMDDWSTVMLDNIVKDPRFEKPGADKHVNTHCSVIFKEWHIRPQVTRIIWTYRDSFVMHLSNAMMKHTHKHDQRPTDKKTFDKAIEIFKDGTQISCDALLQLANKKKGKNLNTKRDLSGGSLAIPGTMALHVTAWDWTSTAIKNRLRDTLPCIQAITLEHLYVETYRPKLLADEWIGALCRVIELSLTERVKSEQTIEKKKLCTFREWKWWDGLVLSDSQADPQVVIDKIQSKIVNKQLQKEERLTLQALEADDHEAIQNLVNYITNMPCALASNAPNALMSADVSEPLEALVHALMLNTSRLRMRHLSNVYGRHFVADDNITDLQIVLPPSHKDEFTSGESYHFHSHDDEATAQHIKRHAQRDAAKQLSHSPEDKGDRVTSRKSSMPPAEHNDVIPLAAHEIVQPVPKPRPVPCKQQQPSPICAASVVSLHTSLCYEHAIFHIQTIILSSDGETTLVVVKNPSPPDVSQSQSHYDTAGNTQRLDPIADHEHVSTDLIDDDTPPAPAVKTVVSADHTMDSDEAHAAANRTVVYAETDAMNLDGLSGTLPALTPSLTSEDVDLLEGFGINDTTWCEDEDHEDAEAEAPDLDDPSDKTYEPTQLLTQKSAVLPPRRCDRPLAVAATAAASSSSTKCSCAATGASSASSTSGHGKQSKKVKTKVHQTAQDDDDLIVIPSI